MNTTVVVTRGRDRHLEHVPRSVAHLHRSKTIPVEIELPSKESIAVGGF
jgi:hypothetical protein